MFCCLCRLIRAALSPCREDYRLLQEIKAERVEPVLDAVFTEAQTWDALSVLGVFFPLSAKSGSAL